jgi:hypothetical protein
MDIFIMCVYIALCVLLFVVTSKHNKLTRELIDALVKENELLTDQNKALRDIIKKYGIN